ncbi:sugar phosphate isomerase/epimerase [Dysgonomonas hofstadii]|uniref:Sugar phosphate isomerase/epimerase n=1 Tax=Dysgonomonas hofstadii TaxID=637886 RepID=A0A840CRE7_9BACT|nr:sugar phosphate isomerase/epimerase [Dysgonomonas hofstadii]MBB4034323.1 sugar phosphate isomerase/epimerase [Dysgonomonas hofstadii]
MKKVLIFSVFCLVLASCNSKVEVKYTPDGQKKDIALQLYSLRDDIKTDYAGTIKKAGEMGYTAVEAANYDSGKFYGKTPEEFKADIEAAGMKVLSSHTGKSLSDEALAKKDFTENMQWWDEAIKAHKAAGMQYIVTPSMPTPKTLADLQTYCEYYNEVGKKCKEAGMKFGYHNHSFEFNKIEDKVFYDYMIENTNPEYVFFEMDVYWVVRGQNSPVDYFNKYKNRFEILHIKDNKELGQSGMVGFDAIFNNTDAAGVKHLVVEVEQYNFTPAESVQKSLEYLQKCPLVKTSYSN